VIFKQNGRRNYAKEAAILLIQLNFLTTERLGKQIMTSRFINTKGRIGCNIPCDLHLEHLNKRLKSIISHCGSNIHQQTLIRASKAIGIVDEICHRGNDSLASKSHSYSHNKPKTKKDFNRVCKVLCLQTVFNEMSGSSQKHSTIQGWGEVLWYLYLSSFKYI
jgi:L1 cell adhesion molecule like protein